MHYDFVSMSSKLEKSVFLFLLEPFQKMDKKNNNNQRTRGWISVVGCSTDSQSVNVVGGFKIDKSCPDALLASMVSCNRSVTRKQNSIVNNLEID